MFNIKKIAMQNDLSFNVLSRESLKSIIGGAELTKVIDCEAVTVEVVMTCTDRWMIYDENGMSQGVNDFGYNCCIGRVCGMQCV